MQLTGGIKIALISMLFVSLAILEASIEPTITKEEPVIVPPVKLATYTDEPLVTSLPDPCGLKEVVCPDEEEAKWTVRNVTAYTSRREETDDTPCLSADGTDICKRAEAGEVLCAANFVPFKTKLEIKTSIEEEQSIVCTVADRMGNSKEGVDLYMEKDLTRALKFGRENLFVKIIK